VSREHVRLTRMGVALALIAAVACAAVPTLTFESRDAAPDGDNDASDDGSTACSGSNPQAAYVCCGAVMCQGDCAGQCDACAAKCTSPGDVCCPKNNNVVCFAPGSICK
jgi:hypothetical protein